MSWRKVKLGDLVDNFSVRAKDVGGAEGLEFFGVSNEFGIIKTKYAAEDKAEDYKIIEQYCFAYNPYRVNVGSIGMVTENIKGLISPAYVVFKPKPNSIKPELLLKFLKSSEGLRQIRLYARGTVRQALRFEDLCNIELSLPNFEEQEILIQKLNTINAKNNLLNFEITHQQEILKQLRQALLKEAIQGKMVKQDKRDGNAKELFKKIKAEKEKLIAEKKPKKEISSIKKEDIPFTIPKNWLWCKLGEIAYIASGSTPKQDAFVSNGIPYLKMYNLKNQKIDFDYKPQYIKEAIHNGQLKRSRTQVGDVIMNIVGPPLGKLAIVPESLPEANFNQAGVLIRPYLFKEINKWIFYYLNEMSEINSIATKGAAGQDNISITQSNNIKIPLPPLPEQRRIIEMLEEKMNLCDELKRNIEQSKNENEMILQATLYEALGIKSIIKDYDNIDESKVYIDENLFLNMSDMKITEILKASKEAVPATIVWKRSEYHADIEQFYAELKKLIDVEKLVVEEKKEKESFLKLASNEN